MRKRRWIIAGGLLVLLGAAVFANWFDLLPLPEVEDGDYPMRRVSISAEQERHPGLWLPSSQTGWWRNGANESVRWVGKDTDWKTSPYPEVKAYPKLKSSRPLYGAVDFSKWLVEPDKATAYFFVVDESQGTGKGYDRLYFDLNHDGDLTNDPPASPLPAPDSTSQQGNGQGEPPTKFSPLQVPFDFGPGYGMTPVEIRPWLSTASEQIWMYFLADEARRGTIRMGRHRFQAIMFRSAVIAGRYDTPYTGLCLLTTGFCQHPILRPWGCGEYLSSLRLLDGKFYSLSTNPPGDTLMVRRYRGEFGVLRVDPGKRQLTKMAISGSMASENTTVPIGRMPSIDDYWMTSVRECEAPVGDYHPVEIRVSYGRLTFTLVYNYHADGKYRGAAGKPSVCPIKIRKDRPFLLDFSNRPEVMFVSPAKAQTFKAGGEVCVDAVLVDPVLHAIIHDLYDTSRKTTYKNAGQTTEGYLSLAPTVTITNSAGKKVAEGVMPFG